MHPSRALVSAALARQRLLAEVRPLPALPCPLPDAAGRVLAAALVAPEDLPAVARAAVDGYAVRAADVLGSSTLRLAGASGVADTTSVALGPGEAWAVATGGAVPAGADTVVMVEHSIRTGDAITLSEPPAPGRNLISRGADLRAGTTIFARGHRLTARDLALAGAAGVDLVNVTRAPRVAILSSGAELVPIGAATIASGALTVRDVNQPTLRVTIAAWGAEVDAAGIVADDAEAVAARITALITTDAPDLLLISGGTSVGAADHTARALALVGARLLFHGVAIRPGRPLLAARYGDTLVMGLPGVPGAALVTCAMFVRPVVAALLGLTPAATEMARLRAAITSAPGREDYVRVRLESEDGVCYATPLAGGSFSLRTMAEATALAIVPAEIAALASGDRVAIERL